MSVTQAIAAVVKHRVRGDPSVMVAALGATLVTTLALAAGLAGTVDRRLSDAWFNTSDRPLGGSIIIVDIERAAKADGDGIRLPRGRLASLLDVTAELGAERILIDLALSGTTTAADDAALERSLGRLGAGRVAITRSAISRRDQGGGAHWERTDVLPRFGAAAEVGSDLAYDPDGLLRRDGIEAISPALPRAAAWLAGSESLLDARSEAIDFGLDARAIPTIDALDLLQGRVASEVIAKRRVIISSSAMGIGYVIPVPRFGTLRRSELTALAAETVAQRCSIHSAGLGVTLLILVLVALATLWFIRLGTIVAALAVVGLSMCCLGIASKVQHDLGLILPAGTVSLGLMIAYGAALMARHPALQRLRDACAGILNRSDLRLARVLDETGEALVTFAPDGEILSMNAAAHRIFEGERESSGSSVRDLLGQQSDALFAAAKISRPARIEATIELLAGHPRHLDLTVNAMPAGKGGWIGIASIRDVTDQRAQLDALRRLATEDPLTKLANRFTFDTVLTRLCAESSSKVGGAEHGMALLIGDLDGFKEVNDTCGHQAGDVLLCEVAARLRAGVPSGTLIARLGGDEFAIILCGEHAVEAAVATLMRTLTDNVSKAMTIDGNTFWVGMSIGAALWTIGSDPSGLVRAADMAMYEAKRTREGKAAACA